MKRKIMVIILAIICSLALAFGLTACGDRNDDPTAHTHSYAWTDNGDGTHNGHCPVVDCDQPDIENEAHVWGSDDKCTKCKAEKPSGGHEHTYSDKWTSAGTDGHYHLANCEHTGEHTKVVPHTYDNAKDTTCNDCGYVRTVEPSHTHTMTPTSAQEPDCTTDGNIAYWYCSGCGKYFSDGNGKIEITLADTVRSKLGHNIQHHDGQAATCTADGWNEYDTCSRCNYTTKTTISAKGHIQNGYNVCTICGITMSTVGLNYILNSDGESYYVSDIGTVVDTDIFIASEYNGKPVTRIGSSAFSGCSSLTSVTIPNSVTIIGRSAFSGCSSLTSITIPDSVTSIGNSAFSGCPIEKATIPAIACGYISNSALKTVVITSGTSIDDGVFFFSSNLMSITIPNSVTSISHAAFSGCGTLSSIMVASSNTKYHSVGNCIIETSKKILVVGCKNSVITTDGSVTSIGAWAFYGCSELASIEIPNTVTNIGHRAFSDCSSLTSITIPNSVTSIGNGVFSGCSNLTSITVENSNTKYHSDNNCIIETASKELIACCKNSVIPIDGSVTSIGKLVFYNCSSLTSIMIPNSVTSIGYSAFDGCSNLTSITIPDSVTSIGYSVFSGCSSLTSITIPDSVTSIGYSAFHGCSGFTSIAIPNSVTSIGDYAFEWCSGLTSINFNGTKAEWNAISKGSNWNSGTGNYIVTCTDGKLDKNGNEIVE